MSLRLEQPNMALSCQIVIAKELYTTRTLWVSPSTVAFSKTLSKSSTGQNFSLRNSISKISKDFKNETFDLFCFFLLIAQIWILLVSLNIHISFWLFCDFQSMLKINKKMGKLFSIKILTYSLNFLTKNAEFSNWIIVKNNINVTFTKSLHSIL